jgi:hypothetical protein
MLQNRPLCTLSCAACDTAGMMSRLLVHVLFNVLMVARMVGTWVDQKLLPKMGFPRDPDAMRADPDWLVSRLKQAGGLPERAAITAVRVERFKANEAFRSIVAAVDVSFTTAAGPETRYFVAKFAPQVTSLRDHAIYLLQENAAKEAGVYLELSADPAVAAPRAWIVELHTLSGNLCIVMDRLVDAVEVTERDGCSAEACGLAMDGLAALHARYWQRDSEAVFLKVVPDVVIDYLSSLFEGPDAALLGKLVLAVWRHDSLAPTTVLHGDARVGNMLFPSPAGGDFAFIDWQAARKGKGAFDVAYFLALSVDASVRQCEETELLQRYHAGLLAGGVQDYRFEQLWDDYRLAQLLAFAFVTLPFMSAESSTTDLNTTGLADLAEVWTRRMLDVLDGLDFPWLAERTGTDATALKAALGRLSDAASGR